MLSRIFLLCLLPSLLAQQQPDQASITAAQSQFDHLYLSADYPDGFGIPLKAQALMEVAYPSGPIELGKAYSAQDVSTLPTISISPLQSAQATFKAPSAFTLMLADANALGNPDSQGNYRHFLQNGATFEDASNGPMKLKAQSGTVVTTYAGPGPLANEGPHRYAWLLFAQPSSFSPPANLSSAGVQPGHWFVNAYVSDSKLGDLLAASFFTVENGHASFTAKPVGQMRNSTTASSNSTAVSTTSNNTMSTHSSTATATSAKNSGSSTHDMIVVLKTLFSVSALMFCCHQFF